mmetsp:Transcript_12914/g.21853  ORF Transcript_12914/g.21853 Transcript_12914/m.21853 type:complete len:263 (-) Transcript_12914:319-1107(-)
MSVPQNPAMSLSQSQSKALQAQYELKRHFDRHRLSKRELLLEAKKQNSQLFNVSMHSLSQTRRSGKKQPPWNDRAHVTFSKGNSFYHTQYKELFDKPFGTHQYNEGLRYVYKTPSNGMREFDEFNHRTKYYWEKREPVKAHSPEREVLDFLEEGFDKEFVVSYSKNNHHRHPFRREYFDQPMTQISKGYLSSPRNKLPLDLYHVGNSHYNLKSNLRSNIQSKNSLSPHSRNLSKLNHNSFNQSKAHLNASPPQARELGAVPY